MKTSLHHVFVYGTLKVEEPNHNWLTKRENGSAKFLGEAVTTAKYPLVIASKYNIPFLIDKPGTGQIVSGEIYEVDDKMLQNLDILEDYPRWYIREKRPFRLKTSVNGDISAWVYLIQTYKSSLLDLPFLSEYKSTGPQPYTEPTLRDESYDACADIQGRAS